MFYINLYIPKTTAQKYRLKTLKELFSKKARDKILALSDIVYDDSRGQGWYSWENLIVLNSSSYGKTYEDVLEENIHESAHVYWDIERAFNSGKRDTFLTKLFLTVHNNDVWDRYLFGLLKAVILDESALQNIWNKNPLKISLSEINDSELFASISSYSMGDMQSLPREIRPFFGEMFKEK